ncbi:unnamed protein product [Orchesella dallaii]|uniref:Uncharacterized protein n=1 Tax=Orchesella dallaii TaxID=48710 RepID=A0ABP1PJ34_9HEXA
MMKRLETSVNDLRQHVHRLDDAHTFREDSPYFKGFSRNTRYSYEMLNQSSTKTSAMESQMKSLQDMMTKLTTVVSVNAVQTSTTPRSPPPPSIPQQPPRQYTRNATPTHQHRLTAHHASLLRLIECFLTQSTVIAAIGPHKSVISSAPNGSIYVAPRNLSHFLLHRRVVLKLATTFI